MIKKCISLIITFSFILTGIANQSLFALRQKEQATKQLRDCIDQTVIPSRIGKATELWIPSKTCKMVVINIQDLHCNAGVQKNIAEIIASLDKKLSLKSVYVEGASGDIDTSLLCGLKQEIVRQKLLDIMIDKGELTGAELYSIVSRRPGLLVGLDDDMRHRENILRLSKIEDMQNTVREIVNGMDEDLLVSNKYI